MVYCPALPASQGNQQVNRETLREVSTPWKGDQLSGAHKSADQWPQCNTDAVPVSPGSLHSAGFVQSSADCQAGPCPAIITPSMGPHARRQAGGRTGRESCRACLSVRWSVFAVSAPLLSCFIAPRFPGILFFLSLEYYKVYKNRSLKSIIACRKCAQTLPFCTSFTFESSLLFPASCRV